VLVPGAQAQKRPDIFKCWNGIKKNKNKIITGLYAFLSLFLGRSFLYPHLRHVVARIALRALQCMQIFTLSKRASASGNFAMV
jgi:hypothetical protein